MLVELYLAKALNVPWDKVHDEAKKWEHVLSEDLIGLMKYWAIQQQILMGHRYPPVMEQSMIDLFPAL